MPYARFYNILHCRPYYLNRRNEILSSKVLFPKISLLVILNDQDIEMQVSEEVFYTRLDVSLQNTSIDDILELLPIHARATIQHTEILNRKTANCYVGPSVQQFVVFFHLSMPLHYCIHNCQEL